MSKEVAVISAQEQELALAVKADLESETDLVVPVLKVCQSLTSEVVEGHAKPGDFINSLTQENHGNEVELVIAAYQKGRFYSDKETGRAYAAIGPVAPSSWPEEYAGKAFTEIDDAEERYRELVNADKFEWGTGPSISTTHNFIGFVAGSEVPIRLSLMRTNNGAARKLKTMLRFAAAPWDNVFVLRTEAQRSSRNEPFQSVVVKQGGKSSPEQRDMAVAIALAVKSDRVADADATAIEDAPAKPEKADGSLDL